MLIDQLGLVGSGFDLFARDLPGAAQPEPNVVLRAYTPGESVFDDAYMMENRWPDA